MMDSAHSSLVWPLAAASAEQSPPPLPTNNIITLMLTLKHSDHWSSSAALKLRSSFLEHHNHLFGQNVLMPMLGR